MNAPCLNGALRRRHVLACVDAYGPPAFTLTPNGPVYTARHSHDRNTFECTLAVLGIRQKNGPRTTPRPKAIQRFQQTLKRWRTARPCDHVLVNA